MSHTNGHVGCIVLKNMLVIMAATTKDSCFMARQAE